MLLLNKLIIQKYIKVEDIFHSLSILGLFFQKQ